MMVKTYEFNGESRTLKQWAAHLGVQYKTLWMRIRDGMPPDRAFSVDPGRLVQRNPARTITKTCQYCGAYFVIPKCRDWREHCCSSACKKAMKSESQAAARDSRTRQCATCGERFVARPWQIRTGIGKYCSVACGAPARSAGRTPEAAARRGQKRREQFAAGLWQPLRGPANGRWKGGREAYRERQRLKDPKERVAKRRAYLRANPGKAREWRQKRRGIGRLPRGTVQRIGKAQRWRCAACRCDIKDGFHVDHILPLALGGEHAPRNLQLLCAPCNLRKSAKHPVDFMQSRGFLL